MNINEMNVSIKELEMNDNFNELFELSKEFFYEYEKHDDEFFKIDVIKKDDIKNYFMKFIKNENAIAYIAVINNEIIGYITLVIKDQPGFMEIKKIGDISGLMVKKCFRKNGIGNILMKKSQEYFKEKDIKYYSVFTAIKNENAINFYKKNGMDEIYLTLLRKIN
jgi:ribosomal protein S18 acetylase RimI-like enzyme